MFLSYNGYLSNIMATFQLWSQLNQTNELTGHDTKDEGARTHVSTRKIKVVLTFTK